MDEKRHPLADGGKWGDLENPREEWDAQRARPNEKKTVVFDRDGVKHVVTLTTGDCPCDVCGHTDMWQCEDAICECCSETCT